MHMRARYSGMKIRPDEAENAEIPKLRGRIPRWLRTALICVGLLAAVCIYVAVQCALPPTKRAIFGDFTVHYTWDHGITGMQVSRIGTPRELDDPISRFLIPRMGRRLTEAEVLRLMRRDRVVRGYAEADIRVYGDIFPCSAELRGHVAVTDLNRKP